MVPSLVNIEIILEIIVIQLVIYNILFVISNNSHPSH